MKKQRYRIFFSKTEEMRYTGHLDLILTWQRTFRRAGLPLSYSEGFSPRPLLNMAAPLPLGYTSTGEIGDFWLSEIIPPDDFQTALKESLPPGLQIQESHIIEDLYASKLPSLVRSVSYSCPISDQDPSLDKKIEMLLSSKSLPRERKGKSYNLRPLIKALDLIPGDTSTSDLVTMTLSTLPGATGRPDEVLLALDIPLHQTQICRTKIILGKGEK